MKHFLIWQRSPWRVSLSTNPWNDVSTSHRLSYTACFTPIYSLMNRFLRLIWPFTSCLCFKDLTVQLVAASNQRSPEPRETAASEVDWQHSLYRTGTPDELKTKMVLYGRRAWATVSQVVLLAVLIGQNLAQEDLKIGRQACGDMQCKGTKPLMYNGYFNGVHFINKTKLWITF